MNKIAKIYLSFIAIIAISIPVCCSDLLKINPIDFCNKVLLPSAKKFWDQQYLQELYAMTPDNKIETIAQLGEKYQEKIGLHAMEVSPIIPIEAIPLFNSFIKKTRKHGTDREKKLYANMTVPSLMIRFECKKALVFTNEEDTYMLRNGYTNTQPTEVDFAKIGTDREEDLTKKEPSFNIENYLTYKEILLATFLGFRIPVFFINAGSRGNNAQKSNDPGYPLEGTMLAVIGSRFEKQGYADYQVMVTEKNPTNKMEDWFRKIWDIFYELKSMTFEDIKQDMASCQERFIPVKSHLKSHSTDAYFDTAIYQKRLTYLWETPLVEENALAKERGIKLDVHMPGVGLGGWKLWFFKSSESPFGYQEKLSLKAISDIANNNTLDAFAAMRINILNVHDKCLHINDVEYEHKDFLPISEEESIKIFFETSDPADLKKMQKNTHLVTFLPYDSNSYRGNEFFLANNKQPLWLNASADPTFICSCTASEIGNPEINPFIKINIYKMFLDSGKFSPQALIGAQNEWERKKKSLGIPNKNKQFRQKKHNQNCKSEAERGINVLISEIDSIVSPPRALSWQNKLPSFINKNTIFVGTIVCSGALFCYLLKQEYFSNYFIKTQAS